jgi:FixJ family two-component response regulator
MSAAVPTVFVVDDDDLVRAAIQSLAELVRMAAAKLEHSLARSTSTLRSGGDFLRRRAGGSRRS